MPDALRELTKQARSTGRRAHGLRNRCKEYLTMHSEEPVLAVFTRRHTGQRADLMAAGLGISMAKKMVQVTQSLDRSLRGFRKLCSNAYLQLPSLCARVYADALRRTLEAPLLRRAARTAPLANEAMTAEDEGAMEAEDKELLLGANLFLSMKNMTKAPHVSVHDLANAINDGLETCRRVDMAIRAMAAAYCQDNLPVTERGEEARAVRMREMEAAVVDVFKTAPRVLRVLRSWVALMLETLDDQEVTSAA